MNTEDRDKERRKAHARKVQEWRDKNREHYNTYQRELMRQRRGAQNPRHEFHFAGTGQDWDPKCVS
jgi:hypothetical protein